MSLSSSSTPSSSTPSYSPLQRRLHWWVALLVGGQFAFQDTMSAAMQAVADDKTPSAFEFIVVTAHVWIGASIALALVYRLWLKRLYPVPVAAGELGKAKSVIAQLSHGLIYLAIFTMAGSGVLYYYFDVAAAADWHEQGKWVVGVLVLIHLLAALWHWKFRKDQVLQRMLGRGPDRQ